MPRVMIKNSNAGPAPNLDASFRDGTLGSAVANKDDSSNNVSQSEEVNSYASKEPKARS